MVLAIYEKGTHIMPEQQYFDSMMVAMLSTYWVLWLALGIFLIVCTWKIFEKAGLAGWESIIPIYNAYCMYKITWGNGWLFLLTFVPIVNVIMGLVTLYKLAVVFGKGIGFFLGLLFLQIIFFPILAFGDAEYTPNFPT